MPRFVKLSRLKGRGGVDTKAIISTLMEEYIPFRQRVEDWEKTEEGVRTRYQFPNYTGALDGKFIPYFNPTTLDHLRY